MFLHFPFDLTNGCKSFINLITELSLNRIRHLTVFLKHLLVNFYQNHNADDEIRTLTSSLTIHRDTYGAHGSEWCLSKWIESIKADFNSVDFMLMLCSLTEQIFLCEVFVWSLGFSFTVLISFLVSFLVYSAYLQRSINNNSIIFIFIRPLTENRTRVQSTVLIVIPWTWKKSKRNYSIPFANGV